MILTVSSPESVHMHFVHLCIKKGKGKGSMKGRDEEGKQRKRRNK